MSKQTPFKKEYTTDVVEMIETVYGDGFLSQGGVVAAQEMLQGLHLKNKTLLDIGCGLGAPVMVLAQHEPTLRVVGIDVDADLVAQAKINAKAQGLSTRTQWLTNIPEAPLPFPDGHFDIVYGKESWLHIANKVAFFKECYRVLKPGGYLVSLDWMHGSPDYSPRMKSFVQVDGLTFHLTTSQEYRDLLQQAGFENIKASDRSQEHLQYTQQDVAFLTGAARSALIEKLGMAAYQAYLSSWQLQAEVFESGEMQTYLIHAQKPND